MKGGGGLPLKFSYKCMLHFPQDHSGDKVKMYEETGGTPKHTFLRGGSSLANPVKMISNMH